MLTPVIHIVIDEEGNARTVNRRVKVKMIVQKHFVTGESLPLIAEHYGIDLADVHAALAYYYDNKSVMDSEMADTQALLEQFGTSGAALHERIAQRTAPSDVSAT